MPNHGESRNHHTEKSEGSTTEYRDARTGEVVYKGPTVTLTQSVSEKWCEGCQKWIPVRGILGVFAWDTEHEKHTEKQ